MEPCACDVSHAPKRVALTGGPGGGKTAFLEAVRRSFCRHVVVLPEAASILFGGGFPRRDTPAPRRAAQRAIYRVQVELERGELEEHRAAVVLCDRGTVDGAAYWDGPEGELWAEVGTSREAELRRYDAVLHLRSPPASAYDRVNPVRIESAEEAAELDRRIELAWRGHPRRAFVDSERDFLRKLGRALELLRREVPACCARHELEGVEPSA